MKGRTHEQLPRKSNAAHEGDADASSTRARDAAFRLRPDLPCVRHRRNQRAPCDRTDARNLPALSRQPTVRNRRSLPSQIWGSRQCWCSAFPSHKDEIGSEGYAPNGIVQEAIRAIKQTQPDLAVIGDVCMCEYTSHGHCGILLKDGVVDNDRTLDLLAETAVAQAEAGVDIVAPSAMMDGQVVAIRDALDDHDHDNIPIMAYSAKYASSFYGPFRTAAESAPQRGDRRGYQMDSANVTEAMREIEHDIFEGADIVMVKPALAYLDVIAKAKQRFDTPLAAYNVSGEYSMVKAAAANGWIDERSIVMEILTGIKRAGADMIISYHAKDVATWLAEVG